ncbi:transcription factor JUNGBRUNNEN 1-like [Tripterygium wilfordii]|uniref:transcription factor JUNGBRUNNEN 1-like n=1 Tax=Tripterygium wilfordii TaxID=458696 RepID=UPI0018F83C1C|nr:transcription factor JUNGBRUNNEN 1-like [Tripterygium wilfordii]
MEITESRDSMPFLLPGLRFHPTRQELALYLERKIAGLTLLPPNMNGIFDDCNDVYGDENGKNEPWNVFGESTERDYFFVFTYLKNVSHKSKRINRKAGIGTWHGRTAPSNVIDCDGKLIAFNRYFTFDVKGSGGAADASGIEHGHWTMHEFSLPDRQSPGDLVLCVIGCNKMISIADEPNSSIKFAKHFSVDDQCNASASTSSGPYSNLGLLSKKRRIHEQNQETSRKRACNSGYSSSSIHYTEGVYQYSTTANCSQNQNLLPMSHNGGFMESSQSVFEQQQQQPMVMHPFFSGFEDGYGDYFLDPIFQQMLQSNDGVHEGSHVPITMQSPSDYSLLTEQNPFFSGFEDNPQDSTEFSISAEAAEKGEGEGHQLLTKLIYMLNYSYSSQVSPNIH